MDIVSIIVGFVAGELFLFFLVLFMDSAAGGRMERALRKEHSDDGA